MPLPIPTHAQAQAQAHPRLRHRCHPWRVEVDLARRVRPRHTLHHAADSRAQPTGNSIRSSVRRSVCDRCRLGPAGACDQCDCCGYGSSPIGERTCGPCKKFLAVRIHSLDSRSSLNLHGQSGEATRQEAESVTSSTRRASRRIADAWAGGRQERGNGVATRDRGEKQRNTPRQWAVVFANIRPA